MAMKIPLTNGGYARVSNQDYEFLVKAGPWFAKKKSNGHVYAARGVHPQILMHKLILIVPQGFVVDHKNEKGLDNRRKNLRGLTHADNIRRSSKHKNLRWDKRRKRWCVRIVINGDVHFKRFKEKKLAKAMIKALKGREQTTPVPSSFRC